METSLKTGFAQIFSCCPKNLSCPNFGGGCSPPRPPGPYAYAILSLFTPCINGYRRHTAGGDPAVVYHPVQGGVAILLGLPHVKETGISSGHLSLWLVCAFTWYLQLNGMG